MNELIDKQALRDEVLHDDTYDNDIVNYYLSVIDAAPAIDAEVVVRCKGCEWWAQNKELGTHYGVCYRFNAVTSKSAHCSYGRRKESEAQT